MDFQQQLLDISNDSYIIDYFQQKSLSEFIKLHIKIELLLQNNQDAILCKLTELSNKSTDNITNELLNIIKLQINTPKQDKASYFIKELNSSLNNHPVLQKIDNNLSILQQNFTGSSSKKGQVTEHILFNNLVKLLHDSNVTNTSHIPNSGDIQISKINKPLIIIDSKNFNTNVPKIDLDKFYHDLQINNSCGILCNSNAGIANREHFQIDIQNNNVYIFISNHQYNNMFFELAIKIIYNIYDIIQFNKIGIIEIDKQLFNRLKLEYNFFLTQFYQHLTLIKTSVISLEKLAFIQLDQFFKTTNNTIKPFYCTICGQGFKTNNTLKTHLKKHNT